MIEALVFITVFGFVTVITLIAILSLDSELRRLRGELMTLKSKMRAIHDKETNRRKGLPEGSMGLKKVETDIKRPGRQAYSGNQANKWVLPNGNGPHMLHRQSSIDFSSRYPLAGGPARREDYAKSYDSGVEADRSSTSERNS